MGDLEFKRELSPDQLREALSLLDRAAGAKPQSPQVEDLSSAERGDPRADQASMTMATQGRLPAIEDLQQRTKHLNLVAAALRGLGIGATATLALFLWSDRAPSPPSVSEIPYEQLLNQPPGQPLKSASPALPVAIPPLDQSPGGSERRPSPGTLVHQDVIRGPLQLRNRWFANSSLEEAGFEPSVPRQSDSFSRLPLLTSLYPSRPTLIRARDPQNARKPARRLGVGTITSFTLDIHPTGAPGCSLTTRAAGGC